MLKAENQSKKLELKESQKENEHLLQELEKKESKAFTSRDQSNFAPGKQTASKNSKKNHNRSDLYSTVPVCIEDLKKFGCWLLLKKSAERHKFKFCVVVCPVLWVTFESSILKELQITACS